MTQPTAHQNTVREAWWYEAHEVERGKKRPGLLSTQSLLLQYDVERAFCAGAWLSVIVLAQAAIEATIRDIGTSDHKTKAAALFRDDEALQRIRALRNELVHPLPPGSSSMVWSVPNGDFAACHAALEDTSKVAVSLMFRYMYAYVLDEGRNSTSAATRR